MTFFDELKDLLRGPLDLIPLTNAAVYSLGFSVFGGRRPGSASLSALSRSPLRNYITAVGCFPASGC